MHSSKCDHTFEIHTLYKHGTRAALAAVFAITLGAGASVAAAQDAAAPPSAPSAQPDTGMAPNAQSDSPSTGANQSMRHQGNGAGMSAMSDADFTREAAQGGMAEVKMGQLAQDKGTTDAVKNFGKQMVTDHSKANDDLKTAASQSNISVPDGISPKDQATYDRLSKLSGSDFDQAYAKAMLKDHMHDISAFRNESQNGKDPNIKQFASQTLPTLQSHMKQAHMMAQSVGVQSGDNGQGHHGGASAQSRSSSQQMTPSDAMPASQPSPQR